jgi:STAM-binding protein
MIRMADTYMDEGNYEKAYILYVKYLSLFIEKVRKIEKIMYAKHMNFWMVLFNFQIREHPGFKQVSSGEKAKVMKTVKAVMPKSEELKTLLRVQYDFDYKDYVKLVEIRRQKEEARAEEERQRKLQVEGENLRKEISKYHDEKTKSLQMQRDFEVAMWHQVRHFLKSIFSVIF